MLARNAGVVFVLVVGMGGFTAGRAAELQSRRGFAEQATASAPPGIPGLVIVRSFRVVDLDGDLDGYADTNETVDLFVTLTNKTGDDLSHVVARLRTSDPKIGCILVDTASIDSLPRGASIELPAPFRLRVDAAANRTSLGEYSARLRVSISADQFATTVRPQSIVMQLDLNVTGPVAATTTFSEGFESGFGNFVLMNLDQNRASNTLSDGWRCSYNDPDNFNSLSYGATDCYLGFAGGQPLINDWHIHAAGAPDGGRAFAGSRSLHYGVHTSGSPGLDTTGLSQMDAIRLASPVNLAARTCVNGSPAAPRSCNVDADCLLDGGGPCRAAQPELSIVHQVSTVDSRNTNTPSGQAADRAIVQASSSVAGPWANLMPYENLYDVQGTDNFSNCTFDPIDDGNNEDDAFDPFDPAHLLGPASTCFPEFAFSYLGDTDEAFLDSNVGRASDGPGVSGSLGTGTWVQSRFDLSRYRGRSILVRFLYTSIKVSDTPTMEALFHWNPTPADDGWYVDDFRVTQTLGSSSTTVTIDIADNSALPASGDCDGDGVGDALDNCRFVTNAGQADMDGDGWGDSCDNCPTVVNTAQADIDGDEIGDSCDTCPRDVRDDFDADSVCGADDNCPDTFNPDQANADGDPLGDLCDNCPAAYNEAQSDADHDGQGDVCDVDDGLLWTFRPSNTLIAWEHEGSTTAWNVYLSDLDVLIGAGLYTQLPGSNALADRRCGLGTFATSDLRVPAPGHVSFSLVTRAGPGGEGDLGTDSHGVPRPNAHPCP